MKYKHYINRFLSERREQEAAGDVKETSIRTAFHALIASIAGKQFKTVTEKTVKSASRTQYYDLVLIRSGLIWGRVEDKDAKTDLDSAVKEKTAADYILDNMIFENGHEMLLIQDGKEIGRCLFFSGESAKKYRGRTEDIETFDKLLQRFIAYVPPQARNYVESLETFQKSVPVLAAEIMGEILHVYEINTDFQNKFNDRVNSLRETISETLSEEDVRQMLVQHILTADLFKEILDKDEYLRFNTIAIAMDSLATALGRSFSHRIETDIRPYYRNLANSLRILGSGNQFGLEVMRQFYETFYKAYDPKRADTFGIVYTPPQIVDFMVAMADNLLKEHFGKNIYSKDVHILDPCLGTGSFMVGVMEYIAEQARGALDYKFENELHANELSILAYYIGNIHVELAYSRLTGGIFNEFKNICYVDTLNNVVTIEQNEEQKIFDFALTEENARRVRAQNEKPLMLIIGNPPYNRQQKSENQNNKNKRYPLIDKRIKDTYSKMGNSQNKHQLYDLYVRFIRWATDRLPEMGMIAYITNRSFLDAFTFDGFRKTVAKEFSYIYCIDLGGDVYSNPKLSGEKNNVFGIKNGIAITFFLKVPPKNTLSPGIRYLNPFEPLATRDDKLAWLTEQRGPNNLQELSWQVIEPDANSSWINQGNQNFKTLLSLGSKKKQRKKSSSTFQHIFSRC